MPQFQAYLSTERKQTSCLTDTVKNIFQSFSIKANTNAPAAM